ncbi:adaptor protein MecA [Barrientosiimonas marina]|uniref:Adapter protein MecA n=1 Tax=Lentibacillus kimchii TaxID=1542911 RepID=A0ABW2UT80_9BACI
MEIERINENTVKFYITYMDIEDRGFQREEIWYNRERGEQLFWQMMEELNYKEDFNVDGPLWIQVQAMDKGLEIIVTKAQISKDGENLELPDDDGQTVDVSVDEKIENVLDYKFGSNQQTDNKNADEDGSLTLIVRFNDFEDIIQLSHYVRVSDDELENALFHYQDDYYLSIVFPEEDDDRQEDLLSQIFEFGIDTDITIHLLEEYGKQIFANNTFGQIRTHFPAMAGRSE